MAKFIEVKATRKNAESQPTIINVTNINYIREWIDDDNEQAVIYFKGTDKYIIVDESYSTMRAELDDA